MYVLDSFFIISPEMIFVSYIYVSIKKNIPINFIELNAIQTQRKIEETKNNPKLILGCFFMLK